MEKLDAHFWNKRYQSEDIPWDAGSITTPLKDYLSNISNKSIKILIPGCGQAHEAAFLHQEGFTNVYVCDWAADALKLFHKNNPAFPEEHLLCIDFFELKIKADLILEQTFFCAINPDLRQNYARKTHSLLNDNGLLAGLLFGIEFDREGPPFGGNVEQYKTLFSPYYKILKMETATNSILPRMGNEVFVELRKK